MRTHSYALDALKVVCCAMVIWDHSSALVKAGEDIFIPVGAGWIPVHIFYMISGLLMVNSYFWRRGDTSPEEETAGFIKHKLKSIYLQYVVSLVLAFAVYLYLHIKSHGMNQVWKVTVQTIPELFLLNVSGVLPREINAPTWYISAMFLAMLLLYYVLARNPKFYLYVAAPAICVLLYGCMYTSDGLYSRSAQFGIFQGSFLRALFGIAFGSVTWLIAEKLRRLRRPRRVILTAVEVALYLVFVVVWMTTGPGTVTIYSALVLLPIMLAITFSGCSYTALLFSSPVWKHILTVSVAFYFNHWAALRVVRQMKWDYSYTKSLMILLGLTAALSAAYFGLIAAIKAFWKKKPQAFED